MKRSTKTVHAQARNLRSLTFLLKKYFEFIFNKSEGGKNNKKHSYSYER